MLFLMQNFYSPFVRRLTRENKNVNLKGKRLLFLPLDISNQQQYLKVEECCNAQTILVKVTPFHWR
ncbi:MAG: hypothetical protein CVU62_00880 [Deltaproteobacteria bacterium HGW-Deltaproteobacteria-2]|nr:MAG: hypothetical protein CVU62_00880 [Deltaproteobacteria bacterium HGW-Deltaproteobacteria-2]